MIPVRCFSCGKLIGQFWESYKERVTKGEDSKAVLDSLGIERFCCRSMFISNVDLVKEIGQFVK
ncbi:MAG: DNA-directed RNA polymerase subunit N [Candidatus Aenigmarchaeota archaeon]|nr:DNA-directed RNA polymerase subunit N [Candidatus Aenigmarchaeota archaeon]